MGRKCWEYLMVGVLSLGFWLGALCQKDVNAVDAASVYIVTLRHSPVAHYYGESDLKWGSNEVERADHETLNTLNRPRNIGISNKRYISHLIRQQNSLLRKALRGEMYLKLYSYHYLINGFAVLVTPQQAEKLSRRKEVASVVQDFSVRTVTTHTPQFLGLPHGVWGKEGGPNFAGEGCVIGFVDTGIDPTHPSFADDLSDHSYPVPAHFSGICEVTRDFPSGSCNRKLIGARHFAASAITRGIFNATQDYASPFDADGHGTHTASIAAGNHNVPVNVAGHWFGNASGMAPRAHISVYKSLYKSFGGFAADVVAAIDQAAQDGVDIINLSITPNRRPIGLATFLNPIDMALLSAVKAGIFVVQASGNSGPSPTSVSSFSPWIFTVGAASHDRCYSNGLTLGNNITISGVGLAPKTHKTRMYTLVSAIHALKNSKKKSVNDIYLRECQDPIHLDQDIVRGNLLLCSYTVRFVFGLSTVKQALETAKNLSAIGVVFYMDPFVIGYQLNPTPMSIPGVIISSPADSKILLRYYNNSLVRDEFTKKIKFGGVARILGGLKPHYHKSAPKVMYYSARGPDPVDSSFEDADIMKPNAIAPGNSIWGAWSSLATDSIEFLGEQFAMISGTSMATPHVAGLAALIKHKFPKLSPSAISSALSTTASCYDKQGNLIMAQRAYNDLDVNQSPATPFDMGSGFVNAAAALDPGLIFDSGFSDFLSFLCGINGSSLIVLNYTGHRCGDYPMSSGADLNLPSITIAKLNETRSLQRTVTNIAANETYSIHLNPPTGVSVMVAPTCFFIAKGHKQILTIVLNATITGSIATFGRLTLQGSNGHVSSIPISVIQKISSNVTN